MGFVYGRMMNGKLEQKRAETFREIASFALKEYEEKECDYFGCIEGATNGYRRWDSPTIVKQVLDMIEKAIIYREFFRTNDPTKKDALFLQYIESNARLDIEYSHYPWV